MGASHFRGYATQEAHHSYTVLRTLALWINCFVTWTNEPLLQLSVIYCLITSFNAPYRLLQHHALPISRWNQNC